MFWLPLISVKDAAGLKGWSPQSLHPYPAIKILFTFSLGSINIEIGIGYPIAK
jgi:hypothetical protein